MHHCDGEERVEKVFNIGRTGGRVRVNILALRGKCQLIQMKRNVKRTFESR